jgi:hypothetical protein
MNRNFTVADRLNQESAMMTLHSLLNALQGLASSRFHQGSPSPFAGSRCAGDGQILTANGVAI